MDAGFCDCSRLAGYGRPRIRKKRQVRVELGPTRDRIQVLYRGRP